MGTLTPLLKEVAFSTPKTCPRCGSFFLAQRSCESCGLCLDQYQDMNFYSFKHDYRENLSSFRQHFPFFENKKNSSFKRYSQQMAKRALYILEMFAHKEKMDSSFPRLFMELSQIIEEMKSYELEANLALLRQQILASPLRFYREATSELLFSQKVGISLDPWVVEKRRRLKVFVMYLLLAMIFSFIAFLLMGAS